MKGRDAAPWLHVSKMFYFSLTEVKWRPSMNMAYIVLTGLIDLEDRWNATVLVLGLVKTVKKQILKRQQ